MLPTGGDASAWLAAIVQSSHDAIVGTSLDGVIVSWNAGAERIFGYRADEIIGHDAAMLRPPDIDAEVARLTSRIAHGERIEHRVVRVRKDGSLVTLFSVSTPIRDDSGAVVGTATVARDLVGQERADALFRSLVETAPDATVCVDERGVIALANAQAERLFGYTREELIGQAVEVLVPEDARPLHVAHRRDYLADPRARPMGAGLELVAVCKDGRKLPVEISLSAVRTEEGLLVSAAIREVTERRQAAIVATSGDAIVARSLDGTVLAWNAGAERLYGYPAEAMIGRVAPFLVPPDRTDDVGDVLEQVRGGEPRAELETQIVRKDGTRIDIAATLSPVRDTAGTVIGTSSIARDVTEARRIDAEQRALNQRLAGYERLESLGRLAGGVAHDFNNLLGIIQIYASVAETHAEDPRLRTAIEHIRDAADQGTRLTRQLLLVGGGDPAEPTVIQLNNVIADLGDLLRGSLGGQVRIDTSLDPGVPEVLADRGRLEQMLINLALNARDAMPDGGMLRIATSAARIDDDGAWLQPALAAGDYVELTVADTGTGMSAEVQEHIFEAFFTTKPADQGTGLGLATVHGIVDEAGGSIEVESTPDVGTSFRILLPAADSTISQNGDRPASA
ncbi:MAG TPA: PAS domain S-box protein [Jatrophihabitans sp.]|jgi:PAS domain S-box-containing protein|nr:PAS domain S-box protein [Jatrophihabitans sp.]